MYGAKTVNECSAVKSDYLSAWKVSVQFVKNCIIIPVVEYRNQNC
jgi:hypothetical protein